jgi:hypothetical protein
MSLRYGGDLVRQDDSSGSDMGSNPTATAKGPQVGELF